MSSALGGVYPVLPALYDADGGIDGPGLQVVVDRLAGAGVDGVVFPGLASEYDHLTLDERVELIAQVGATARGRLTFIVGASGVSDAESEALAVAGARAGAVAAMIMTPHRLGADVDALIAFYRRIREVSGLAPLIQNAPAPMGLGLGVDAIAAVIEGVGGVVYVKEETQPCGQRISQILKRAPGVAGVFGGAGGRYIIDELTRGAVGTMPACELAETHVALMAAHRAGDDALARTLYERMLPILMMQAVFRWRLTKAVLVERGWIDNALTRAPGAGLDDHDHAEMRRWLERVSDLLIPLRVAAA